MSKNSTSKNITTCSICGEIKKLATKIACGNCYRKSRKKINPAKNCSNCGKRYKDSGPICQPCVGRIRRRKSKGTPCSCCLRIGVEIVHIEKSLCKSCNQKRLDSEFPGRKEHRIIRRRKKYRKERGLPVNAPKKEQKGYWIAAEYAYFMKKGHPNARKDGSISVARWTMSEKLGRPLMENETVHHINGNKLDNHPDNLQVLLKGLHPPGVGHIILPSVSASHD